VVVLFDEPNLESISTLMGDVMRTLFEHKATVMGVSTVFLLGVLGVPFGDGNSPEARRAAVDALLRGNGSRIRIAHGECDSLVGTFGSGPRFVYDAVIPGFLEILKRLLDAEPGAAFEVS